MRSLSRRGFAGILAAPALAQQLAPWQPVFEYDDDDARITLTDGCAISNSLAMACGVTRHPLEAAPRQVLFVSTNGGKTWKERKAPSMPTRFFALGEQHIWLCGYNALHFTRDQGGKWEKRDQPGRATQVHFTDPETGFAWGGDGRIFRSTDGGQNWRKIALDDPQLDKAARWTSLRFTDRTTGMLAGYASVELDASDTMPDGSPIDRKLRKRLGKTILMLLRTSDAGNTWKTSTHPAPGRVSALVSGVNGSYVVFDAGDSTVADTQIALLDLDTLASKRVFRQENVRVQDLWLNADGSVLAAATDEGSVSVTRRDGFTVRTYRSTTGETWDDVKVHYRARGREIAFRPGVGGPWLVVSGGMILGLRQ